MYTAAGRSAPKSLFLNSATCSVPRVELFYSAVAECIQQNRTVLLFTRFNK